MKTVENTLKIIRVRKKHQPWLRKISGSLVAAMLVQCVTPYVSHASAGNAINQATQNQSRVPAGSKRAFARTANTGKFTIKALKEAGEHGGRLTPTTEDASRFSATANEAFGACMQLWNQHRWEEAKTAMQAFLAAYPDDPWAGEAELHVACFHRFQGRNQLAEQILVDLYENNGDNPIGRKALVRLGHLYYDTYRYQAAYEVFWTLLQMNPIENEKTFALNWLYHIPRGWMAAAKARECGPKAFGFAAWLLDGSVQVKQYVAAEKQRRGKDKAGENQRAYLPPVSFAQVARQYPWAGEKGSPAGVTPAEMRQVLADAGIGMETRSLGYDELLGCVSEDNAAVLCIPAPSDPLFEAPADIVAATQEKILKQVQFAGNGVAADLGHYMVLVKATGRNAWLIDPENGLLQMDAVALKDLWLRGREEGLAVFLSRSSAQGKFPGKRVDAEAESAFSGGCCGHEIDNEDTGCADDGTAKGMPEHSVNILNLNYLVTDTPIWIESPRGDDLNLTLTYNNRQATSAKYDIEDVQFYPFGYRWSPPYDGNFALDPATNILVHFPNGMEVYFDRLQDGSYEPRDSRYMDHFHLVENQDDSVTVSLKDGLKKYYFHPHTLPDRQQTLYRIEDQFGQGIDINRDNGGRITNVVSDVTGSSLNYMYNLNGNVTNVYERNGSGAATGRHAAFTYEATSGSNAVLKTMTDMGGYTTTFEYGSQTYEGYGSAGVVTSDHHITAFTWPNQGRWEFNLEQTHYEDYDEPLRLTVTDPELNTTVYDAYTFGEDGPVGKKDRNGMTQVWGLDRVNDNVVGRYGAMANDRYDSTYNRRGEYLDYQDYDLISGKREIVLDRTVTEEYTGILGLSSSSEWVATDTAYLERKDVHYHYGSFTNGARTITLTNMVYESVNGTLSNTDTWTESIVQDEHFDPVQMVNRAGDITYLDRTNRLVKAVRVHPYGGSEKTVYEATYNEFGHLQTATVDEGLTNKMEYTYGPQGQLSRIDYPDGTHEGFLYDPDTYFALEHTNRTGKVTAVIPDDMGRSLEIHYPDGTDEVLSYGCCAADSFKDRHDVTSNFDYDGNKRLDWATVPMDEDTDTHIEYGYMGEGELKSLAYGAYGKELAERTFDYTVKNGWTRLQSRNTPEGKTPKAWTYTFRGLPETLSDGRGVVTSYVWNEAKSQLKTKTVDGSSAGLETVTVNYGYDGLDRLTNIVKTVSGLGEIWRESYTYDDRARIDVVTTKVQNIPGQTAALEYTIDYDYNNRGFLESREVTVGGTTSVSSSYTYEPDSARLKSVSDDFASVQYGYDQYGRLKTQTNAIVGASSSQTVKTWNYDDYSKLASLSISNSTALLWGRTYGYDVERITSITNSADGTHWEYGYDYLGQLKAADLYSSSNTLSRVERYKYDAVGNMTHKGIAGAGADVRLVANKDDEAVQYQRHKTATLMGTVGSTNATLSLPMSGTEVVQDNLGNWIAPLVPMYPMPDESGGMTPPTSPATNSNIRIQLKAVVPGQSNTYQLAEFRVEPTSSGLAYDANGALLELPDIGTNSVAQTLAWNAEGRLSAVTSNSVEVGKYFYDALGRRIAKKEENTISIYLWDNMVPFGTADSTGKLSEFYTRGAGLGGGVGSLISFHDFDKSETYLVHNNHRGDVILETSIDGSVAGEQEFSPFGELLQSTCESRFGFSSKEVDSSGLVYFGFRYFATSLAIWASQDPAMELGSVNLYVFCENDPINAIDPLGLKSKGYIDVSGGGGADDYGHMGSKKIFHGKPGYFDVYSHGLNGHFTDPQGNRISVDDIYKAMKAAGYENGQPINLVVCHIGVQGGDAEILSKKANAQVYAADDVVTLKWANQSWTFMRPYKQTTSGDWYVIKPDGSRNQK
jgi:RHS repeat-associated protein